MQCGLKSEGWRYEVLAFNSRGNIDNEVDDWVKNLLEKLLNRTMSRSVSAGVTVSSLGPSWVRLFYYISLIIHILLRWSGYQTGPISDWYLDLKSTKIVIEVHLDDCHLKVAILSQIEIQHLKVAICLISIQFLGFLTHDLLLLKVKG